MAIRKGTRVIVTGGNLCKHGVVVGKGSDGEPWIRCDDGQEWSALDVNIRRERERRRGK